MRSWLKSTTIFRLLGRSSFGSVAFRSMDRLSGPARIMVVSDLDQTMVDHDDPENLSLLRLNALWEAHYRHDSLLVFSSGRSFVDYKKLREEKPLLTPDITIMSVGTEIAYGEDMLPDDDWEHFLNQKWDRNIVEEVSKLPYLQFQSETAQRPYKVSFKVEKEHAQEAITTLSTTLEKRGLDVKIVYSSGVDLDVLPRRAGKGQALAYVLKKLSCDGKAPLSVLVCGDSGNDADLFSVPDVYGVLVSNALEELIEWHAENAKENPKIIHATERCADGIVQAIRHFGLGISTSPRGVVAYAEWNKENENENFTPACEVVKFYSMYERWCRADIGDSESHIQDITGNLYPNGVIIYPWGVELSLCEAADALRQYYGGRKGKQFRVWIDRVSTAQIGSDTWLMRFNKWEFFEGKRQCCIVTALLQFRAEGPEAFIWVHLHQTWLDGTGNVEEGSWIF
ncbi:sucrose-phosphatase 1-like isoform X2 [Nymphaea colorata]|uniref:sucrose-phosphatase 1-like isoform X2 n=1 Tax=Nymphaea colorata TaxID=210225 RepID=UPI00129DFD59|nr:sucrose-phosphatase 1-like isoform X2 [Nymphaea colorata]